MIAEREISQAEHDQAEREFASWNRLLPPVSKKDRRLAAFGFESERAGRLERVTIQPHETLDIRPLPSYQNPERYFLRLYQHVWPPFYSEVKLRTVCPKLSTWSLVDEPGPCAACAAGLEPELHGLVYGLVNDRRRAICVKFTHRNLDTLKYLIGEATADFPTGCWVRLHADDRWKLSCLPLQREPLDEKAFKTAVVMGGLHVVAFQARADKQRDMAAAYAGWQQARERTPQEGQAKELIKLLPHCTLVPIPWGCKGPQEIGWQNMPYGLVNTPEHRQKLDGGNIGLLCGQDEEAVAKKLVPEQVIVGLDADSEDFAQAVYSQNPWLKDTFAVQGKRGEKWFFAVAGKGSRLARQSTKIMQKTAESAAKDVGDWLATGKQGVILGLHPCGKMYEHNSKPLVVIGIGDFKLPRTCYLARSVVTLPSAREGYRHLKYKDRPQTAGPILNVKLLQQVHQSGDSIQAACPACRVAGKDTAGDNLMIWPSGHYKCSAFIGLSPEENHRHNQEIYRLAGLERSRDYD